MELTSDKLTMLENKVVMMYILKKTRKPISYRVFLELVTGLADVNFFDFHQLLQDLLNDGYIANYQEDRKIEKNLYTKDIDEAAKIIEEFKKNSIFRKILKDDEVESEDEIKDEPLDLREKKEEEKIEEEKAEETEIKQSKEEILNKNVNKKENQEEKSEFDEIVEDETLEGEQKLTDILENQKEAEEKEKITLYYLTEKGKQALSLSIDTLPGITKLRIDSDFNKYYKIIREAYSVLTSYIPKKDLVTCKIVENYQEIFKMEIVVGSVEQAKNISKNWKSRADEIYLDLLKKLSEED